jgi:hypothetical protein
MSRTNASGIAKTATDRAMAVRRERGSPRLIGRLSPLGELATARATQPRGRDRHLDRRQRVDDADIAAMREQ